MHDLSSLTHWSRGSCRQGLSFQCYIPQQVCRLSGERAKDKWRKGLEEIKISAERFGEQTFFLLFNLSQLCVGPYYFYIPIYRHHLLFLSSFPPERGNSLMNLAKDYFETKTFFSIARKQNGCWDLSIPIVAQLDDWYRILSQDSKYLGWGSSPSFSNTCHSFCHQPLISK